jgi:hypothetical protein
MSDRAKLPYLEFTKWAGLNTKTSEDILPEAQLVVAQNVDFFKKYGAISKPDGMSRILSSKVTESGSAVKIPWLGFYKAADLDGQILRHTIMAAGQNLFRIESDGSTTQLTGAAGNPITTSRIADLYHHHDKFGDFLLLQNQNPDLIGQGDIPVKYDGAEIHRLGIVAPGNTETEVEEFDDATDFTVTNGTAADDTTTTQDGSSVSLTKTNAGATTVSMFKDLGAGATFNADTSGEDKVYVWVYIPRGQIQYLASSGRAISVYMGSDSTLGNNYQRHDFQIGALLEGWNLLVMTTDPAPSGASGTEVGTPVRTALRSIQFEVTTANAADLIAGIRWDNMYITDEGRLTAVGDGSADKNLAAGDHQYETTYVSKFGHESNAGPAFTVTNTSGEQNNLTNIPTSTDPQVIARKIYRTVEGGNILLYLTTIEDNVTTTYTDNTDSLSLGSTNPPEEGSVNLDNSPPPKAGIIKVWKRTVFLAGDPTNPETVFFSEDDTPEGYPVLNAVTLDDKVTAMYETLSGLVVETETGKWQCLGDNPDFKFDKIIEGIGCVGRRAAGEARLVGYAADRDGLYLYDLNEPIKISEVIRDKFDAINRVNIELMHITHAKKLNGMYQFNADSNGDFTNNFVYQYLQDVQSRSDLINGWWWTLSLPSNVNILDAEEIEDPNGDSHLYGSGDDGMVYELFDSNEQNFIDADGNASAIESEFQSKYIRPGDKVQAPATPTHLEGSSGRVDPIWIEVRRSGSGASTWTSTIDTANGPSTDATPRSTVDVTISFTGDQSLKRVAIPSSLVAAEYIRVKMNNNQLNVSDAILAVRVYYHLRPGQFEV